MTVSLPPTQIVPDLLGRGIKYHTAIERRGVFERSGGEESRPMKHIASRKMRHDSRHNLTATSRLLISREHAYTGEGGGGRERRLQI